MQQRESLTRLQASYATFAFHPELARRIDAQFAEFEPVVQRREDASLRAAILAGRYAPTLADARQFYPGRKINTLFAPGSKIPLYVPERFADPDLEAEAVQVIQNACHLAKVTGRRSHLEAALDDPTVRQVSRLPGNQASVVFGQRLESLGAPQMASAVASSASQPSPTPITGVAHTVASANLRVTTGRLGEGGLSDGVVLRVDPERLLVPMIDRSEEERTRREYRNRQNEQQRQFMMAYYVTLAEYAQESGNKEVSKQAMFGVQGLLKGTPGFIAADILATLGAGPAGAAQRGLLRGGAGLASTIGGEAMEATLLARIRAAFERNGGKILQGSEVDAYLTYREAEDKHG